MSDHQDVGTIYVLSNRDQSLAKIGLTRDGIAAALHETLSANGMDDGVLAASVAHILAAGAWLESAVASG